MSQHVFSLKTNLIVFAVLMVLLVLTVAAASVITNEALEVPVAMAIAIAKTLVIAVYFMHLKHSKRLTWLFAGAGTLWLALLAAFTLSDVLTRDWLRSPVTPASGYFSGSPGQVYYQPTPETTGETVFGTPPAREAPDGSGPDRDAH